MTLPDEATIKALAPALIEGLHKIGALSEAHASDAKGALTAIAAIYQMLRAGLAGELSPQTVEGAIHKLAGALEANNKAADAALDAKFDKGVG
jgi:hypothetical protein